MTTVHRGWTDPGIRRIVILSFITLSALISSAGHALAHNVTEGDAGYIQEIWGVNIIPFMYLGAKHMVTGYDHILFLLGVVFFLYRMKDVGIYVSLFGLSVVYKALDNLGAYQRWFGFQPNTKAATLIFGFFHGTGLATKILDYEIASDGLLANLLAFNVGVELGQIMALAVILIVMGFWRKSPNFFRQAYTANVVMMSMGFILMGLQITGYFVAT
jgi:hypothetical protein